MRKAEFLNIYSSSCNIQDHNYCANGANDLHISFFLLLGAYGITKLIDELQLRNLTQNPWHIQGACATTGDGLYEGLERLSKMIREFKKSGGKVSL